MPTEKTLNDAFYETLKDVYYAEKQSVRVLKKSAKAVKSPALKQLFEQHMEESATQVDRLSQAFERLKRSPLVPGPVRQCKASRPKHLRLRQRL